MYELTKNEELILLSIWKLRENAYGVTIKENFKKITGKALNYGSLYNTLYLLTRNGLVESRESEPESSSFKYSIEKAMAHIKYQPKFSLEDGINELIDEAEKLL